MSCWDVLRDGAPYADADLLTTMPPKGVLLSPSGFIAERLQAKKTQRSSEIEADPPVLDGQLLDLLRPSKPWFQRRNPSYRPGP